MHPTQLRNHLLSHFHILVDVLTLPMSYSSVISDFSPHLHVHHRLNLVCNLLRLYRNRLACMSKKSSKLMLKCTERHVKHPVTASRHFSRILNV